MKDRLWLFVIGNNLVPIALIVLSAFVYLKYVKPTALDKEKSTHVETVSTPKYVEKIIEKHHYSIAPEGGRFFFLPKEELEKERPGSVNPIVMQDNSSQIVARGEIPPSRGATQVDAVRIQDPSGDARFRLDYRQLPPPFFDLKREIHGGLYYGAAGENLLEGEISIKPLRIGKIEAVVKARVGLERKESQFNGAFLVGIEY